MPRKRARSACAGAPRVPPPLPPATGRRRPRAAAHAATRCRGSGELLGEPGGVLLGAETAGVAEDDVVAREAEFGAGHGSLGVGEGGRVDAVGDDGRIVEAGELVQPLGDGRGGRDDEVAAAQEAAKARAQVRVAHGARDEGRVGVGVQVVARVVGEDERDAARCAIGAASLPLWNGWWTWMMSSVSARRRASEESESANRQPVSPHGMPGERTTFGSASS